MKVLQLSTYDGGQGAARATFRLHRALRDAGIDSTLRVAQASSGDPWVRAPRSKPRQALALLRSNASWWLQKPQRSANPVTHSVAALPSRLNRELNASGADLLHLHWLQDEFLSVEAIGRLRGPLLWTLHDSWVFCGSEHYPASAADQRFREGYNRRNRPTGDRGLDLDRWTWRRKRRAWASLLPRLQLIAPSRWMAQQAVASALLAGVPCAVIPNALPAAFRPIPRQQARALLDWPQGLRLILFGAIDGTVDARKGWDLLAAALALLAGERSDLEAVLLGQSAPAQGSTPPLPLPSRTPGRFHDDVSLALAYAAADVVVVPSRLDNLPQAASEALACGTPVVAFRQGGMGDLIEHRRNGYLAEPFDPVDLARGLAWCLDTPGLASRPALLHSWSPAAVAGAHQDLYRQVLQR
ncbi:MAG: glycosyltransferase [Cyanobacteria bacterium K_DeepCast_35m_m1_288]|nr:glycosyltransferase [Cyanobacteria bacterium K_DeepCast_35m_m1_288]MBM5796850.1 glycosyltransferase [Cyanobacteria bacterium K_Offshore_0m_m2_072]